MVDIVVTAAIVRKNNTILVAQRKGDLQGKWEFPGGKLEDGESLEECLKRELKEELGIDCKIEHYLGESIYEYNNKTIRLKAFFAKHVSGDFQIRVHQSIRWIHISELLTLDWAPADVSIVHQLINCMDQSNSSTDFLTKSREK